MRTSLTVTSGVGLLLIGYIAGGSQVLSPAALLAQGGKGKARPGADAQAAPSLSDEAKTKIKAAADALKAAQEALEAENRFGTSATKGINAFTVLTGGSLTAGGSMDDLKSAGGVDPETFGALYAGLAADAVVVDLGRDSENRLTYKGRVVRMLPVSAIRGAYARRSEITGEDLLPVVEDSSKKPAKKKAEPTEAETEEQ
jgi:hypothetical protein